MEFIISVLTVRGGMTSIEQAIGIIKGMSGTLQVFPLDEETREGILQVERTIKSQMGMEVKNEGLEQCLHRRYVLCILKNKQFRPPPEPTVQLLADEGTVIGTEVLPGQHGQYQGRDDILWLCEDFVVYMDRQPTKREYFFMPPVSFPELQDIDGVDNIVSCSPSPLGDIIIKNRYGIEDDPKNATILVGFNAPD
jgi:hypothetical protein